MYLPAAVAALLLLLGTAAALDSPSGGADDSCLALPYRADKGKCGAYRLSDEDIQESLDRLCNPGER